MSNTKTPTYTAQSHAKTSKLYSAKNSLDLVEADVLLPWHCNVQSKPTAFPVQRSVVISVEFHVLWRTDCRACSRKSFTGYLRSGSAVEGDRRKTKACFSCLASRQLSASWVPLGAECASSNQKFETGLLSGSLRLMVQKVLYTADSRAEKILLVVLATAAYLPHTLW